MKKFTFTLQSVQDQREIRRELAEREYAESVVAVQQAVEALERAGHERDAATEAYRKYLESGEVEPVEITLHTNHIRALIYREDESRARVKALEQARDSKLKAVVSATRDEKAINNLRERHRSRYEAEASRVEQIALDEMATMAFIRRAE